MRGRPHQRRGEPHGVHQVHDQRQLQPTPSSSQVTTGREICKNSLEFIRSLQVQSRGGGGLGHHLRVRQGSRGQQAAQGGGGQDQQPRAQGERHHYCVTFPEIRSHSYIFHAVYAGVRRRYLLNFSCFGDQRTLVERKL